jgi:putative ABC transport system substrate-binding protein
MAAALALTGAGPQTPAYAEARILVISSHRVKPYEEALEGFREQLAKRGIQANIEAAAAEGDATRASQAMERAERDGASLVVTFGTLATSAARGKSAVIPVVAGLILDEREIHARANMTGVTIDFPAETHFQWLTRILPAAENIGVLYNPAHNQHKIDAATKAAGTLGLTLHARKVEEPAELADALESLGKSVDALWGVPDELIYSAQTAQHMLLFSLRNRIPFVGLSGTWVKAGALYSLDCDYRDIGAQCADIAAGLLQPAKGAAAVPPARPRRVVYFLNLKTAAQMKVELPESVIQGAREVFR